MITANALSQWCDNFLKINEFSDYCPNGLQVDAGQDISKVVTGVTACADLIESAIVTKAQAVMVHHGYFWKGEDPRLIGMKGNRIRKLIQHGISLIAYHLPLDAHPEIGNNAQLGKLLNLHNSQPLYPEQKHSIGNIFETEEISPDELITRIEQTLQRTPLHIANTNSDNRLKHLKRIGVCSGAAQDMIEQAKLMGCDAFISGEISERTTHSARELNIDYFACGHHATEIAGIKALGEIIRTEFDLDVEFIDIKNPV